MKQLDGDAHAPSTLPEGVTHTTPDEAGAAPDDRSFPAGNRQPPWPHLWLQLVLLAGQALCAVVGLTFMLVPSPGTLKALELALPAYLILRTASEADEGRLDRVMVGKRLAIATAALLLVLLWP